MEGGLGLLSRVSEARARKWRHLGGGGTSAQGGGPQMEGRLTGRVEGEGEGGVTQGKVVTGHIKDWFREWSCWSGRRIFLSSGV